MNKLLMCVILCSLAIPAESTYVLFKLDIKNKSKQFMLKAATQHFEWGRWTDGESLGNISPDSNLILNIQGRTMSLSGVEGWMKWDIIHTGMNYKIYILLYHYLLIVLFSDTTTLRLNKDGLFLPI